jgi:hypothetical protein
MLVDLPSPAKAALESTNEVSIEKHKFLMPVLQGNSCFCQVLTGTFATNLYSNRVKYT